jgi:hypothetical protein
MEPPSASPISTNGNKYATYREVFDYYDQGQNVVIYQHRDRSPEVEYKRKLIAFRELMDLSDEQLLIISFRRYSRREYVFLLQKESAGPIRDLIAGKFMPRWERTKKDGYFTFLYGQ